MNSIWQTTRFTLLEIFNMRAFQLLVLIALVLLPLAATVFSNLFLLDIGKVRMDILIAGNRIIASLYILVIAVMLMANDISKGMIHLFLTPPSSRREYLIGRFFGLLTGLAIILLAASIGGEAVLGLTFSEKDPIYRHGLEQGDGVLLALFTFYQHISILAAALFICTWATSMAEMFVFSSCILMLAWTLPPVLNAMQTTEVLQRTPEWIASLLKSTSYFLPNLNGSEIGLALAHGLPLESVWPHIAEHTGYALLMLGLALFSLSRRDL